MTIKMSRNKKDNSSHTEKVILRQTLLRKLDAAPIILETFGGWGKLYESCYQSCCYGLVIDKDPQKADHLARQRPAWAVYQTDSVSALRAGLGAEQPFNWLDVDAYGDPWPALRAFFQSERTFAKRLCIVVTDGLRIKINLRGAWETASLLDAVLRWGNDGLTENYLAACREMLEETAIQAGYGLDYWHGYYCGHSDQITHYAAILRLR